MDTPPDRRVASSHRPSDRSQRDDRSATTTQLRRLRTEQASPASEHLDMMTVGAALSLFNDADRDVPESVGQVLPQIEAAIGLITESLRCGGRLIYVGAGTSGRLGLLDAVECPPTFGTDPGTVTALLAGGTGAFEQAIEGAEDDDDSAADDLESIGVCADDVVVGLTASGRTPYVVGGLIAARKAGASTVSVSCNPSSVVSRYADVAIEVDTGPEVLTGSTRLKAGTAQKLVCNMLTTVSMVQLGKVYRNLMVDVKPTNTKLVDRAQRIVAEATGVEHDVAEQALESAERRPKTAIVMLLAGVDAERADAALASNGGSVRAALDDHLVR